MTYKNSPGQDGASAPLPSCHLLLRSGEAGSQRDRSRTPGMCHRAAREPRPCPALLKACPSQLQQSRMRSEALVALSVFGRGSWTIRKLSWRLPCLHARKRGNALYPLLLKTLLQVTLGRIFRLLLVLSDRGGRCQLTVEWLSARRHPPGSWLSSWWPTEGDVKVLRCKTWTLT